MEISNPGAGGLKLVKFSIHHDKIRKNPILPSEKWISTHFNLFYFPFLVRILSGTSDTFHRNCWRQKYLTSYILKTWTSSESPLNILLLESTLRPSHIAWRQGMATLWLWSPPGAALWTLTTNSTWNLYMENTQSWEARKIPRYSRILVKPLHLVTTT